MQLTELLNLLKTAKEAREIDERREEIAQLLPKVRIMFDYDQKNSAHQYDLWMHSIHTVLGLPREGSDDMLYLGALLHDIGKPSCQVRGKREGDEDMHYYGHPAVSERIVREEVIPQLMEKAPLTPDEQRRLLYYVEYHDDRVNLFTKHIKRHLQIPVSFEEFQNLMALEVADALAHVQIPIVRKRVEVCGALAGESGRELYRKYQKESKMTAEEKKQEMIKNGPGKLQGREFSYDEFESGEVIFEKKKNHLPAMGWNSWNAFGSGNTEELTKCMADRLVELELRELGYRYVVLDDGCYKPERVDGQIANEEVKFPSGFRALADYIHEKGLKFGMYNDIGTNLCAGAAVGTCGYELSDAENYIKWGVDFLKVDNCYYLWDNATFSDAANAKYVYAPNIRSIRVTGGDFRAEYSAVADGILRGQGAAKTESYVTNIGTFDGTGPDASPVGERSGELAFLVTVPKAGKYQLTVNYAADKEVGTGSWLQVALGEKGEAALVYDDFLPETGGKEVFADSPAILLECREGENLLRLMNHRRQENTLHSYAAMLQGLNEADPDHDVILSICEWGKTQPQNWGYKVGDSWRILNDITFRVGSDGDPGVGAWASDYTTSVTAQYNKAVIMDEFAGLDKGWNDPDMMMIGMNGLTETMCRSHMAMWCMLNAPLMLGLDLRRIERGDALWQIISNKELIALNQDALGVQAKRIYSSKMTDVSYEGQAPDKAYIRDNERVDILAKPLSDGSVALSFLNLSQEKSCEGYETDVKTIAAYLGEKLADRAAFEQAAGYVVTDLWTGEVTENTSGIFRVDSLDGCDNVTIRVKARA